MFMMVGCVQEELNALKHGLNDVIPNDLLAGLTAEVCHSGRSQCCGGRYVCCYFVCLFFAKRITDISLINITSSTEF